MKRILLITAAGLFATSALAHDIFKNNIETEGHVLLDPVMMQKSEFYGTSLLEANEQPWGIGAPIRNSPMETGRDEQYGSVLFDVRPELVNTF